MQPKLADCFVVPKSMSVFFLVFWISIVFYHAVFIMRVENDCMFEKIVPVPVQVFIDDCF